MTFSEFGGGETSHRSPSHEERGLSRDYIDLGEAHETIAEGGSDTGHLTAAEEIDEAIRSDRANPDIRPASDFVQPIPFPEPLHEDAPSSLTQALHRSLFQPDSDRSRDRKIEAEDNWVNESCKQLLTWGARKFATLALDAWVPGLGRIADIGLKIMDLAQSAGALESDNPRVTVPVGKFLGGLDFDISVPLGGSMLEAARHTKCFVAPDQSNWTGGWSLQASEPTQKSPADQGGSEPLTKPPDEKGDQRPRLKPQRIAPSRADQPGGWQPWNRVEVGYSCEVDLRPLGLAADPAHRARQLYALAFQYAELLKADRPQGIEFLVFSDSATGDGIWIRISEPPS